LLYIYIYIYIAVVAASAISGKISSPTHISRLSTIASSSFSNATSTSSKVPIITYETNRNPSSEQSLETSKSSTEPVIIPGFPETIEGELLFCHEDNLNTDGIYPG